jgi:HEPN domain-containing protein
MDDALHLSTRAWLAKADSDLRTAGILSKDELAPLDTAIYHCQQAAEKAVKAFLHHRGAAVQKTHHITRLIETAALLESAFSGFADDADLLSPLATAFRYPDESDWNAPLQPTEEEFNEALAAARRIYDFVLSALPAETHPV